MEEITQLSNELTILNEYINQRINGANKEITSPAYSRMVSPPYEREILAIYRIKKLLELIYSDDQAEQQTNDEWRADYDGSSSQVINFRPEISGNKLSPFYESVKNAGINGIRLSGNGLLITSGRAITPELDKRIKQNLPRLVKVASPDTGESLYQYTGYRTIFIDKRPFLAITFRDIYSGSIAERFFNIELRNTHGKSFKTGNNGEFRIVGNTKRLQEGMFLKFWMDAVKQIPDNRPAHIYRYMSSWLSGVVVSCTNPMPHHGITKLTKLKYEGHLYKIT